MNESDWLSRVLDTARVNGWLVSHARPARTEHGYRTAIQGDRGAPDLLLARAGEVVLAELKGPRGRLGPGQAAWLQACGSHGRLWKPNDWTAVLAELSRPATAAIVTRTT